MLRHRARPREGRSTADRIEPAPIPVGKAPDEGAKLGKDRIDLGRGGRAGESGFTTVALIVDLLAAQGDVTSVDSGAEPALNDR